jgi:adenosyl cobinamide kinase/adenosyl cobinamide phosphate guanylyltransferase
MLHLVIGPAGSGKSEYAERLVASLSGGTVYVGTLPTSMFYQEIIQVHRDRRPRCWALLEFTGNIECDFRLLRNAETSFDNLLIDGVTFYLARVCALFGPPQTLLPDAAALLYSFKHHQGQIVIVDMPPPLQMAPEERAFVRQIHVAIFRIANSVRWFSHGTPSLIGRAVALQRMHPRDRQGSERRGPLCVK